MLGALATVTLMAGITGIRLLDGTEPTIRTTGRTGESEGPASSSPGPTTSNTTPSPPPDASPSPSTNVTQPSASASPPAPDVTPKPVRIPTEGNGDFEVAPGEEAASADDQVSYTVEIEGDLPFRPRASARMIGATLDDERGWFGVLGTTFRQVVENPEIRILVATPSTTDALCAPLQTLGRVSCRNGELVVLNARRWAFGITDYRGNLRSYRNYLVNHEVGHVLGRSHVGCPGRGLPAPVMQQQTYGLDGCIQNPWPTVA